MKWEFSKLVDIPFPKLLENFTHALSKVNKHIFQFPESTEMDQLSLEVLQGIPMTFKAGKKNSKRASRIVRGPNSTKAPYLIGIGNQFLPDLDLFCYTDGVALFKARATEAVLLLMEAYWIFSVSFPTAVKEQCVFLSAIMFHDQSGRLIGKDFCHYVSVSNLLKDAQLL